MTLDNRPFIAALHPCPAEDYVETDIIGTGIKISFEIVSRFYVCQ